MHDCALGRDGKPSAPRVEHGYYTGNGINVKNGKGVCENPYRPYFFILIQKFEKPRTKSTCGESDNE